MHGRVIFVGDAAHQVSPFGARGVNSGVQDAENLAWKLAAILAGEAGPGLLASYDDRARCRRRTRISAIPPARPISSRPSREPGLSAMPSSRSAEHHPFARRMLNSGRLSTPTVYAGTPLSTPDTDRFGGTAGLGAPLPDAPLRRADGSEAWLLNLLGPRFTLIYCGDELPCALPAHVRLLRIGRDLLDEAGLFQQRYDARAGSAYLVRPDQHLCARFRRVEASVEGRRRARLGMGAAR